MFAIKSNLPLTVVVLAMALGIRSQSLAESPPADDSLRLCLQDRGEQLDDQDDEPRPGRIRMQMKMPPDGIEYTNDVGIRMVSEPQVNRFIKEDKAQKCSELAKQLDRTQCDIKLVPDARKQVSSQKLYVDACRSIVVIFVSRKHRDHWHVVSAATGFFVAPGVIATNRHVFEDKDEYMFAMTADTKVHPIQEVLAANMDNDAALCRIDAKHYKPLALRTKIPVGAPVRVISHPKGRHYTLAQGLVSRKYIRPPSRPKKPAAPQDSDQKAGKPKHVAKSPTKWITITAGFGVGSSGGPVFDLFGNVIGVATSTQSVKVGEEDDKFSQLVFRDCVPADVILGLVGKPNAEKEAAAEKETEREKEAVPTGA